MLSPPPLLQHNHACACALAATTGGASGAHGVTPLLQVFWHT